MTLVNLPKTITLCNQWFEKIFKSTAGQFSHFIPPENTRKPGISRGYKMGTLARNGLI